FTHIISGGPLLLRNGVISTTEAYKREGFDASFHSFWHPRTAVGKKADGTLLFVTITAAKLGVRRGVTLQQLAKLFVEWGATDAVNLDGGYSSMMIIRNQVVSFKRTQRDRSQSGDKSKPAASEKQPEKNMKPPLSEKKTDKDAKPAVSVKKTDKNAKPSLSEKKTEKSEKPAASEKQQPQKASPERNTRTARGNRRVRPMPTFQGRSISDAILIFPRSPAKSK
ncbi:MAG: phosphodiester glycosidase family protein, partial [Candidatus Poribacteria bacterium]|nr:phosphodiester glycosidase family protein [Candidatus Poribacteria bacterium]